MLDKTWTYRRGDLYLADLGNPVGSQQGGVRPVVVLQNNAGNQHAPTLTIAPLTTKVHKKKNQPTHYYLSHAKGLKHSSTVLAEQLCTVDKRTIICYLGRVNKWQMKGIDEAVKAQLGYYMPWRTERKFRYENGGIKNG